ncbi:MAG: carboxylesterase family protein [Woeseiaceae bacterium]|nr:carboxylesterase family protein [Woeseiaceae bacterium]
MRALLASILLLLLAGCSKAPQVSVDGELLVGQYEGAVAAFRGIPFADPPVGELRWKAPQPPASRAERRDASEFAPACMQTMRILDWYRYMAETFGASRDYHADLDVSEDCLYLNVWTRSLNPDARLPVMVWIHGGSNKSGWSYEDNYRGHVLASQNVVVVSVAYRHGLFGFLSHPDLATADATANFGLWDLVAALQWIQENIEIFGGDPDRVTLFGESAGAQNILALMMSEPARDLFHRGILQSNATFGLSMHGLGEEMQRGAALAELVGAGSMDELRKIDAARLLDVYTENFDDYYHLAAIDQQLIHRSTWDSILNGGFGDHEIMIGTNRDEWLDSVGDVSGADVEETAAKHPQIGGIDALPWVAGETDPRRAMDRLVTAAEMVCPSQSLAARRTASGGKAWVYWFTRQRQDAGGEKVGVYHGAEYPYIFGVHDDYMTTTDDDRRLSALMQRYWINFATSGNPNGHGLHEWPLFARPGPQMQELGDTVRAVPAIEPEMCAAFERWTEAGEN